ncbi:MAG: amidohydrolase [Pirellulales bacterium]
MPRLRMPALLLLCTLAAAAARPASLLAGEPDQWVKDHLGELLGLYQQLHAAPELSGQERQTSERLAAELEAIGATVTRGVGGHGVVAVIQNGPGPCLMIRADLDALPITEQTRLPFASQVKVKDESGAQVGVMHACGHDIHMTCLVGVAGYLAAHKNRWNGTALLVGQPAEERGEGAKAMLKDGLFEKFPRPRHALALHVDSALAAGSIGYRAGYSLANVDTLDITVLGRGGHGAYPHTTIDPIVQAAHLIVELQSIVSREIKPTEPAVITVGSIHGGTKHNVISDRCHLQLTVRSYSPDVREHLLKAIRRKANAVAAGADAPQPIITVVEGTPALLNDEKLVERLVPVFRRVLGDDKVIPSDPSMGGEDFSQYGLAGVPVFMFRLGAVDAQRLEGYRRAGSQPPSLHSPVFYPDAEPAIVTGVTAMASAALEMMPPKE